MVKRHVEGAVRTAELKRRIANAGIDLFLISEPAETQRLMQT
jgi:hypothetical protein